MNISITKNCNNLCSYCFQSKESNKLMTVENVDRILKWSRLKKPTSIGVMGGEPSINPYFIDICKHIVNSGYSVAVFTNLIMEDSILKDLLGINNLDILVNTNYDDANKSIFDRNIRSIYERKKDSLWNLNSAIFLGITLAKTDKNSIDRIVNLVKEDENNIVKGIRIGHAIPSKNNNIDTMTNSAFGENTLELIEKVHTIDPRKVFVFDCAVNNCIMKEEIYKLLKGNDKVFNLKNTCTEPVVDINPDYSTSWCASLEDELGVKNIFDYNNYHHLTQSLKKRKFEMEKNPSSCRNKECSSISCRGLCLGIESSIERSSKNETNIRR